MEQGGQHHRPGQYLERKNHAPDEIRIADHQFGRANQAFGKEPMDDQAREQHDRETGLAAFDRSEEHTSELQSLMRISYAVFCLKKKKNKQTQSHHTTKHKKTDTTRT